jgi:superfamily II DNA or RNA helicase
MPHKLYDYQVEAVEKFIQNKALLIDADTGAGKTIMGIVAMVTLAIEKKIKKVLITGPINALTSWQKTSLRDPATGEVTEIHPVELLKEKYGVDIDLVGLRSVWRGNLKYSDCLLRKSNDGTYFFEGNYNNYDMLIIDEIHEVKGHTALQTQFLLELSKASYGMIYKLGFSATPREKTKADSWSIYSILKEDIFPPVSTFINKYCLLNDYFKPTRDKPGEALDAEFAATIAPYTYVVDRKITDKLKPKQGKNQVYKVERTKEMEEAERRLKRYLMEKYIGMPVNVMHEAALLFNLYAGVYTEVTYIPSPDVIGMVIEHKERKYIKSNKFEILNNLMDTLPKPVVIFASYNAEIEMLLEYCKLKNLRSSLIKGGVTKDKRLTIRDDFNESNIDVLVMNITAGSAALDLYNGRDTIFFGINPALIKNIQGKGRIARVGSNHDRNTNHYILTKGTLEEKFYKLVNSKNTSAKKIQQTIMNYIKEEEAHE